MEYKIEKKSGKARAGRINTLHGEILTPAFVPVGTNATVKAVTPHTIKEIGAQTIIANTYHLFLRPGSEVVRDMGGIHKFMNIDIPIMTDSGGFQVFSLGEGFDKGVSKFAESKEQTSRAPAVFDEKILGEHGKLALIDEDGVSFTSHIDGSLHRFTPERSVEIQHNLGADIFFAFDECTSPTADYEYQKEALRRTHNWARRSLTAHRTNLEANKKQAIYGIVQGGRFLDLRKESAKEIGEMNFDGFGIGGSFSKADLGESLRVQMSELPEEKPVHLLGIGDLESVLEGIAHGVDTFDCVSPTRLARNGSIYTEEGIIDLTKSRFRGDKMPITEKTLPEFNGFTRGYIHHLFNTKEMLGPMILSAHNTYFMVDFVRRAREAILEDRFDEFRSRYS